MGCSAGDGNGVVGAGSVIAVAKPMAWVAGAGKLVPAGTSRYCRAGIAGSAQVVL
jgi:hypothetical protein